MDTSNKFAWAVGRMSVAFVTTGKNGHSSLEWIGFGFAILTVIATFVIGGLPFFGYSPRAYALLFGGSFGCWWLWRFAEKTVKQEISKLLVAYSIFVVWLVMAYLWHGLPATEVLRKTASTHILAILTFFSILPVASSNRFRNAFVAVLVGTILSSGALAVMQWLRFEWAWDVARMLNARFIPLWGLSTPGFSMSTVSLSYQTLLAAPFLLTFILSIRATHVPLALIIPLSLAIPVIAIVVQSRSLLAGLWIATFFIIMRMRSAGGGRVAIVTFVVGLILASALSTANGVAIIKTHIDPPWLNPSLLADANQQTTTDGGEPPTSGAIRMLAVAKVFHAMDRIPEYLIGPGPIKYSYLMAHEENLGAYPHNVFLNALMISGVIGFILLCWIHWVSIFLVFKIERTTSSEIVSASAAALLAFFVQTQFHNDSFVFGSFYPWIILAILFGESIRSS